MGCVEKCAKGCCCCCEVGATVLKYTVYLIIFVIPIVIIVSLGITMIAIGAVYIDDCPYEKMVPIWLIVGAIIPFALLLVMIIAARDKSKSILSCRRILAYIVLAVFLSWLIAGSVWVLDTWIHAKDDGCGNSNCCFHILKYTSIVMLIVHWCFFALSLLILIYIFIKICCFNKK